MHSTEPPLSPRERLLCLSRSYTFANAIYLVPLTFAVLALFLLSILSHGVTKTLDAADISGPQGIWFILLFCSQIVSWSHHDWRRDMLDGGSLPSGTVRLWLGSAALNLCTIGFYLWQMTDTGPAGLRLKNWELHLLIATLPCYALVVAACALRLCIRLRTKPLHNRRWLLS